MNDQQAQHYYETKYPRVRINYKGRALPSPKKRGLFGWVKTDRSPNLAFGVQEFITPASVFVQNLAVQHLPRVWPAGEHVDDFRAHLAQQVVCDLLTYVSDNTQTGYTEFWQFPTETVQLRKGDCEDGANLMASLMLAWGIPEWRVRVTCGAMGPGGGHAYVTYCRRTDNHWVICDWCYEQDPDVAVADKPLLADRRDTYLPDVWWSATARHAYGRSSMTFREFPA